MRKTWQVKNQNDLTLQLIKGLGYPTKINKKGEIFIYVKEENKEYKIGQIGAKTKKKKKLDDDEVINVVV